MKTTPQLSIADKSFQLNLPLFVFLGAFLWSIGLLFIHFAGAAFFVKNSLWLVGLYLLSIPVAWLLVKGIALAFKLSGVNILIAVVIMCFTASLLDGVALTWFPLLYGLQTPADLLAAAWLLWFGGISLCVGIIITSTEYEG